MSKLIKIKMQTEDKKKKNKETKFVTDSIDVLQFGRPLGGSFYTNQTIQNKYMKTYGSSASVNGAKIISNE